MKMRRLGHTSLVVSEVGFGTWAIGGDRYGRTDDRQSVLAIEHALELGCNFFDTADSYGQGHSEELLGSALRSAGRLHSVVVATKGGRYDPSQAEHCDFSRAALLRSLQGSLRRLGREFVDLYQLHNPPLDLLRSGEMIDTLRSLFGSGLARFTGVCVQTVAEARAALSNSEFESLQMPHNLFSLLKPQMSLECLRDRVSSSGKGLLACEPLASGLLSGRHKSDTEYGEADFRQQWSWELRQQRVSMVEAVRALLRRKDCTMAQAAVRFVLDEPLVSSVIVGMKTPEQVTENCFATTLPSFGDLFTDLQTPEQNAPSVRL